jgi:hypothetical protein
MFCASLNRGAVVANVTAHVCKQAREASQRAWHAMFAVKKLKSANRASSLLLQEFASLVSHSKSISS